MFEIWGDGLRMGHVVCMSRRKERTVGAIKKSTCDPHDLTRVDTVNLTVLNTAWSCFIFMLGSFELTGGALLSYYSSMCQDSVRIRNVSNHTRQRVFADAASERCHLRRSIFHIILYNRVSQID